MNAPVCLDSKPLTVPPLNHAAAPELRQLAPVGSLPWAAPWLLAPMAEAPDECPGLAWNGAREAAQP